MRPVLVVFVPFSGGYFLSCFCLTVNAVIAPDLIADFGLLLDRFGPLVCWWCR